MALAYTGCFEVFRVVLDNLPAVNVPLIRKCRILNRDIKTIADDVYTHNDLLYDSFDENNVFSTDRFMVAAKDVYDSCGSAALFDKLKNQRAPAVLGDTSDSDFSAIHFLEYNNTEDVEYNRLVELLDPCDITHLWLQPTSSGITPLMMSCMQDLRSDAIERFVAHIRKYHIVLGATDTQMLHDSILMCLTTSRSRWEFYGNIHDNGMLECLSDNGPALSSFLPIFVLGISKIHNMSFWKSDFKTDFREFIQNRAYPKEGFAAFLRSHGRDVASSIISASTRFVKLKILDYVWEDLYFPAFENKEDAMMLFLTDYIRFGPCFSLCSAQDVYTDAVEAYVNGTWNASAVIRCVREMSCICKPRCEWCWVV